MLLDLTLTTTFALSTFIGDLSHESHRPTYGVGAGYFVENVGLRFDALTLGTTHDQGFAPFADEADVRLVMFLLLPSACHATSTATRLCGGIGLGTVNVNSPEARQDYGTWHYAVSMRHELLPQWGLALEGMVRYIGRVEQRVNGDDTQFSLVTYGMGLSLGL